MNYELIEEVVDKLAPLSKIQVATVMAIRSIIREALIQYDTKLREQGLLS